MSPDASLHTLQVTISLHQMPMQQDNKATSGCFLRETITLSPPRNLLPKLAIQRKGVRESN